MTHIISPVSCTPDDSTIESFLDISKNLLDMVRIESCVLEKMGQFTVEGFLTQKMDLLKSFEDQAARIIKTLSSTPHISAEKTLLLEEIRAIQSALTLNTAHHIKSLAGKSVASSSPCEVSAWH
ncbi:MAG: hypothetical protein WC043_07605 [Pseudobdellovibrionaceae bacterium]